MRRTLTAIAAVAVCAVAGMARAGEIAPADVAFEDMAVATSLTGAPGNPEEGAKALANRGLGNCLACDGVADRWSPEELRAIVVDAKQVFSDETMMPGFYSLNLGKDVRKDLAGKTILTAQQVEDVVAYLATLKE
jgi:sulfur-oxidizing protein SoxX